MNTQVKKKFWKDVHVVQSESGFGISLDDKPLRTPAKNSLVVPTEELATYVADEWLTISDEIDPTRLRFTKLCNASIDSMPEKFDAVVEMLADYTDTDLLCYRAESPEGLALRQSSYWDPLLEWVDQNHGLKLVQTTGIIPVKQPSGSREGIKIWLEQLNMFEMMACHDLTIMSGSIIICRAVCDGFLNASQAWEASRIDEDWQAEVWGADEDAEKAANAKFEDFSAATKLFQAVHAA